jgi:PAS domain S-box-containing protein
MDPAYPDAAEASPNLVFITDPKGRVVRVNARWLAYTGLTPAEVEAQRGEPLGLVHPDDLEATWAAWKRALETGESFEISYRLRSAQDGRYRWFLARAEPYRNASGEIVRWVGAATEIDDRVRAAERSRFISEAATVLSSSLDRQQLVDDFVRLAVRRFSDGCIVSLRDPTGELVHAGMAHRDPAAEARARERAGRLPFNPASPVSRVLETKAPILIPHVDDPKHTGWRNTDGVRLTGIFEPLDSVIVVPLLVAGRVGGTIGFVATEGNFTFDPDDLEIAEAVARHAAAALENAASFARERESTERFRFLAQATNELFAGHDARANLGGLLQSIVGRWADWAVIYVIESDGSVRADAVAARDPAYAAVAELQSERVFTPDGEHAFTRAVGRHRAVRRADLSGWDELHAGFQPFLLRAGESLRPRSLVLVPLFTPDADYGMLGVYLADRNYEPSDIELFEELGRRASLALEHAGSVSREARLVQTLQEVILPSQLPTIPGAVLSIVYAPATSSDAPVGGDWYDAFALADGRIVFSIGDVAGRGLRASAIMGKLRHAINVIAMYEAEPARILDVAERVVLQRYPQAIVTAFVALYDPREHRIRYANAGHPYPLLRRWDGTVEPLAAGGLPIGLRTMVPPAKSHSRRLDDAALLAFYTDGVTEATRDIEHGERLLNEALARDAALYVRAPAQLVASSCLAGSPHGDDAALMIVSFPRSIGWSFDAENARAAWNARGAFMAQLRSEGAPGGDFHAAEIIFGELIGNVVRHAPGPIDIALEWRDDIGVLHVIDRGHGFRYRAPTRVDTLREHGRGLWLIDRFGGRVDIEQLPHFGTHVRVELPVRKGAAVRKRAGPGVTSAV